MSQSVLTTKRDPFRWLKVSIAFLSALAFLFPIVWMFFVSMKPEGTAASSAIDWFLPPYTFSNYVNIIAGSDVFLWIWNSFFVGAVTTLLTLVLTSMAAFAFSKMRFRYRKALYLFFLAGLMVPGEAMIIPLYEIVGSMGLLDTYAGLILPGIAAPLGVIILKSFFDGVPNELIESARLDGCSDFRLYWSIVLPLAKAAVAAVGILTFIGSWNNFLWPYLAIISEALYTLPVGIPMFNSNYSETYILPMTVNAIASLPVIIAFLFFEKQIVKGVSFSGIKG
ncbi:MULTISPECIES: carbohydrate ABC transporter permease [Shouchella]|uniref:L-arabinose transport system permease protein AraQ n=5 Tax=Bacillaceae TaxID=186817 RepID=A0A060M2B6_9BACI|nr:MULTISPECIES: carbohydrate ABC transporter permease [Bacillaceae]RQW20146.1 carbohydrate ABC transporter permease [Bacillus sp. C1-1]GAF21320.1 alpha-arabinosides ABC transport system, permease protein 2 [Bacillus sp. JCM 19047]AIC94239.1 L-arabinose transport system permease protein AraQ [Shouchella lehensis G1]KQL57848.1 sugar ABC transporter permease [Alkalicoccobacillus plakortidis]MBG9785854.1 sugar ABC transporter permease [Shouchella lehensis]